MSKTVTGQKYGHTTALIKSKLEPAIEKLISEFNKMLKKSGVHVGAEIQWYIDEVGNEEEHSKKRDER